jgi:branched-chain amino acid aminotransferase
LPVDELESFEEAGACGTAAIIAPIGEVHDLETGKTINYCKDGKPGPISTSIYNRLLGYSLEMKRTNSDGQKSLDEAYNNST